jgi:hypothetical protein
MHTQIYTNMSIFMTINIYIFVYIHTHIHSYIHTFICIYIYNIHSIPDILPPDNNFFFIMSLTSTCSDDDVYLEYDSGKGFHINYSCLHVLRKTHKLVQ